MAQVDGGIVFLGSVLVILHIFAVTIAALKLKVLHRDRFERISMAYFPAKAAVAVAAILALVCNTTLGLQWMLFAQTSAVPIMLKTVLSDGLLVPLAFFLSTVVLATPLSQLVVLAPTGASKGESGPLGARASSEEGCDAATGADGSADNNRANDDGGERPDRGSDRDEGTGDSSRAYRSSGGAGGYVSIFPSSSASDLDSSTTQPPSNNRMSATSITSSYSISEESFRSPQPALATDGFFSPLGQSTAPANRRRGRANSVDSNSSGSGSGSEHGGATTRSNRGGGGSQRVRHFTRYWQTQMRLAAAFIHGNRADVEFAEPWESTARWNLWLRTRPVIAALVVVLAAYVGFAVVESRSTVTYRDGRDVASCASIDAGNVEVASCVDDVRASARLPHHLKVVRPRIFDAFALLLAAAYALLWVRQGVATMGAIRHVASRRAFRRTFYAVYVMLLGRAFLHALLLLRSSRAGARNATLTVFSDALDLAALLALTLTMGTSASPERLFPRFTPVIVAVRAQLAGCALCCCCTTVSGAPPHAAARPGGAPDVAGGSGGPAGAEASDPRADGTYDRQGGAPASAPTSSSFASTAELGFESSTAILRQSRSTDPRRKLRHVASRSDDDDHGDDDDSGTRGAGGRAGTEFVRHAALRVAGGDANTVPYSPASPSES